MMLSRSIRRLAAIAAVFAVTLQALWPLLSHARPKELTLLAPLCTVDGVTHYLEIKAGKPTPLDQRSAQHGEHCKLCVFGTDKPVAAMAGDVLRAFSCEARDAGLPGIEDPDRVCATALLARPRAPPLVS